MAVENLEKSLHTSFFGAKYYFTTAFTLSCCISKIWVFENSQHIPHFLGFQNMMILNLHGILFHAVVFFKPEHDLLFKPASTYCEQCLSSILWMQLKIKMFNVICFSDRNSSHSSRTFWFLSFLTISAFSKHLSLECKP